MKDYREYTVQDLIEIISSNPKLFPKGLKTKIHSGDFEGNTYHKKHQVMCDGKSLFFGFELNEGTF